MKDYTRPTTAVVVGVYGAWLKVRQGPSVWTAQLAGGLRPGDVALGDTVILRHEHDKTYIIGKSDVAATATPQSTTTQTVVQSIVVDDDTNSTLDHGLLFGREDDDHQQYFNADRGDARYAALLHSHDVDPVAHHDLTGHDDYDDHAQYLNNARHDTVTRHALGSVVPHDTLDGLTDVAIGTNKDVGHFLVYNGTTWGNYDPHPYLQHHQIQGLNDYDDHPRYLDIDRHDTVDRHTLGTVVPHDVHANLGGLDQDDHWEVYPNFHDSEIITGVWRFTETTTFGGNIMPATPNLSNIGSQSYPFLSGHISELWGTRFVEETIQVAGGRWLIPKSSSKLRSPCSPGVDLILVDSGLYAAGDYLMFSEPGRFEVMKVVEDYGAGDIGVERAVELPPSDPGYHVGDTWGTGSVFVNLGKLGDGWLEAQGGAQVGLSVWAWTGAGWADRVEAVRLGDLANLADYGAAHKYGIFIGDYEANSWMSYDRENGLRIRGEAIIQGTLSVYAGDGSVIINEDGIRIGGSGSAAIIGGEVYDVVAGSYVKTGDYGFRVYDFSGIPRISMLARKTTGPFFRLGSDVDTHYLQWSNGTLDIAGTLHVGQGDLAGWTIEANRIVSNGVYIQAIGSINLNKSGQSGWINLDATQVIYPLSIGTQAVSSNPFRVTWGGKLIATDVEISGGSYTKINNNGIAITVGGEELSQIRWLKPNSDYCGYVTGDYGTTTASLSVVGADILSLSSVSGSVQVETGGDFKFNVYRDLVVKNGGDDTTKFTVAHLTGNTEIYGDALVRGAHKVKRDSVDYTGYVFIPLTTPLTSTSYDGNDAIAIGTVTVDVNTVFGVPSAAKAALLRVACNWTSSNSGYHMVVRPAGASLAAMRLLAHNLYMQEQTFVCPLNANGEIELVVTGLAAQNVDIRVWGYFI